MKNYRIVIGSPVNYEELTAEIVINDEYILLVQMERGRENMIVEFYDKRILTTVYLDDLVQALDEAKALLSK